MTAIYLEERVCTGRPVFPVEKEDVSMNKRVIKADIPLTCVKPVCIGAAILGIVFLVSGMWAAGLCMLLGSYILEKNRYRCPKCRGKLDMKYPLLKGGRCPFCGEILRQ